MIRRNPDGSITCPNCRKMYFPVLGERDPYKLIQDQFPKAKLWQREQLISGICSDKCWEEFVGHEE